MLQGKTAVITGGVRGIGKCIAETFCKNGANVIICDISSPEAAAKTEEELKAYGTRVRMYNGDITDPQTAENIAQIIKDEFDKKVDILVNNAGITNDKLMIKMKPEEFTKVIDVNLSASKAGLVGMTLSAAKELGRRGIRVNGIAPGFVETDMTAVLTDEQKSHAAENISMQRLGQPQDIANTALYLASDLSTYVTGQIIAVDGGLIM